MTMSDSRAVVALRYAVRALPEAWVLPEIHVPESRPHDLLLRYLVLLLEAWVARTSLDAIVTRNLAVRWYEDDPRVGIDPDVALVEPAPPDAHQLSSLCLWKPGHAVPRLAIEVVSKNHPYKDYKDIHEKYAASGIGELWVLDPELVGPRSLGGPVPIQQWVRRDGALERMHFGEGPFFSEAIDAWLWGDPVRITDDRAGVHVWLTHEEAERAAKEAERAAKEAERAAKEAERAEKEAERAAKEAAEARIAELERRMAELEQR